MISFGIYKNIISYYINYKSNFIILMMDNLGYLYKIEINADKLIHSFIIYSIYNTFNLTLYIEEIENIMFFKLKFNNLTL